MNIAEKIELVEQTLTRAAEKIGDVTAPAMERYYHRYPNTKALFEELNSGDRTQLEGMMIENSLYCLMTWFESPGEVEILLSNSLLHHHDTLAIDPKWYDYLLEVTAELVGETIPPENTQELAVWNELSQALQNIMTETVTRFLSEPKKNT